VTVQFTQSVQPTRPILVAMVITPQKQALAFGLRRSSASPAHPLLSIHYVTRSHGIMIPYEYFRAEAGFTALTIAVGKTSSSCRRHVALS
jgi:hypothetical protein